MISKTWKVPKKPTCQEIYSNIQHQIVTFSNASFTEKQSKSHYETPTTTDTCIFIVGIDSKQ